MKEKIRTIYNEALDRIKNVHIGCFKDTDKPLFLISEEYPGLWLEHVYDSVMLAKLEPSYVDIAENAINLFIDRQKEDGHLPFVVLDRNKYPAQSKDDISRYCQIQECVSFYTLALEVYEMNGDRAFLEKIYESGKKWDIWLRRNRMTTGRGLIEMFVGNDVGHDNSGRTEGMSCPGHISSQTDASVLPPYDGITPILAVDLNCNFYGDETALSRMAEKLGLNDEAKAWKESAFEIKKKIFEYCYDENDAFFYDVDRNDKKRKYKSSTIFHLFLERVLDKETDKEITDRIYREHIKNPEEFWTPYPFPSMAVNDPSVSRHKSPNSWGYYTQGLIVLRCSRWMDYYGYAEDYDYILEKWIEAWTVHYDKIKLAQEIDPMTGVPTVSSEYYSSTLLGYVYGTRRLGLL